MELDSEEFNPTRGEAWTNGSVPQSWGIFDAEDFRSRPKVLKSDFDRCATALRD